jgi:hypothetical protein
MTTTNAWDREHARAAGLEESERANAARRARAIMDETPNVPGPLQPIPARVLALMVLLEPAPRPVSTIGELLGIAQASASELVDAAVALEVVERTRARTDRRIHLVQLTPKGARLRRARRGSGGAAR